MYTVVRYLYDFDPDTGLILAVACGIEARGNLPSTYDLSEVRDGKRQAVDE
jgi:hypothetical protein